VISFAGSIQVSGVPPQADQNLIFADTSYETTHSWNSEPQNIEQEISNDEVCSG
jgi:hypothetical protein